MDEDINIYEPEITSQQPLDIEKPTDAFDDILEGGVIKTKLNEKVIIQRIAKDLYKDANSGLRELYNNSARACRIAKKEYGEDNPMVTVKLDEATRTLIIEDNGTGISIKRFKKVLLELGTSDNLDSEEVGQFGMGFASYTTLSSLITLETFARNGDKYAMVAKDGLSFQPVGECHLKNYGTKLTMICYNEVEFDGLVNTLQSITRFSDVPTKIVVDNFVCLPDNIIDGEQWAKQTTFRKLAQEYKRDDLDMIEIDNEDYTFVALVGGNTVPYNPVSKFLLNVPIEIDLNLPFRWYLLNIKDERKFKPMPDRDRMTLDAEKKLFKMIKTRLQEYFRDLTANSYQEFKDNPRKNEILWLAHNNEYSPRSLEIVLLKLSNVYMREVQYDTRLYYDRDAIYWLANNPNLIYQGWKNRNLTDKLKEVEPNALLVIANKSKKIKWKESVKFLTDWGVPTSKQVLASHKVKVDYDRPSTSIDLISHTHYPDEYYKHGYVDWDEIDDNFIRVDSMPMNDMISKVKIFPSDYTFVRNAKELDNTDCVLLSDWEKEIPTMKILTNKGEIAIEDFTQDKVWCCNDYEEQYDNILAKRDEVIIYDKTNLLPLRLHNKFIPITQMTMNGLLNDYYDNYSPDEHSLNFFCNHFTEIPECYVELFLSSLHCIYDDYAIKDKHPHFEKVLTIIKSLNTFNKDDEVEKLIAYTNINSESPYIRKAKDELSLNSVRRIKTDSVLTEAWLKSVALNVIFGDSEFKNIQQEMVSYYHAWNVSLVTHSKEFDFRDGMQIQGITLQFRGCKIKIKDDHTFVEFLVILQ